MRSRQSRCRLSICQARGRQLRVRASDERERGPEQQPENNAPEMSNRRVLLMAGAAGIASALPMWLSMAARGRGRAQAATLADQQVLLLLTMHVTLSPPVCARAYIGFQGPEATSGTCPWQPQSASVKESVAEQCCAAMRRRVCPQSGILASPQPPSLLTRHPFRSLRRRWSYCLLQERSELRLPVSDAAAGPEAKVLGRVLRTASAGTPCAAGSGSGLFLADLGSGPPLLEPAKAAASSAVADWVPWAAAVVGGVAGGAAALTQTRKVCDGVTRNASLEGS